MCSNFVFGNEQHPEWMLWYTMGSLQGSSRRFLHPGEYCFIISIKDLISYLLIIVSQVMDMLGPSLWDVWNSLGQS